MSFLSHGLNATQAKNQGNKQGAHYEEVMLHFLRSAREMRIKISLGYVPRIALARRNIVEDFSPAMLISFPSSVPAGEGF
jgi:hypothetical protein